MQEQLLENARVLVVDDDAQNVRYIKDVLEWAGYKQVAGTTQPTEVLALLHQFQPDLILLDLIMPAMDGYEVMQVLQSEIRSDSYLPILVLTSDTSQEAKRRALSYGAKDFLTKPFSPTEIRHRVSHLLETRFLHLKCRDQAALLASGAAGDAVMENAAASELFERLTRVAAYRFDPSGERMRRVGALCGRVARLLGESDSWSRLLERASQLCDIGMVAAPRPGTAQADDEVFPAHTSIGADILAGSELPELRLAAEIARSHHEHWDGTGFPEGLRGEEIPLSGRVVAAALACEAAIGEGEGAGASEHEALERLVKEAGTRYDPSVIEALMATVGSKVEATA